MIMLKKIHKVEFAKELKKIFSTNKNSNINKKHITIQATNALCKNFDIFGYFIIKKKITHLNIHIDEIDIILKRKFIHHIKEFFIYYSKYFIINFPNLPHDELLKMIGTKNYLHYCTKLNKTPQWKKEYLVQQKLKIQHNKQLKKYNTFSDCCDLLNRFPFSKFNFPTEQNKDRFVFYFYMYDEKQKNILLDFLKKHKLDKHKKLLELIIENKINEEIFYYAFGFSYQNNKLIRFTLYTKFDIKLLKDRNIETFMTNKHQLTINPDYKNIWYYAVDFFSNKQEEFKIYDEPYIFNEILKNKELNTIFNKKRCVKVDKYKSKQIYTTKYEFEIQKHFNKLEQEKLKKYNLYNSKNQILAIYIKKNEIIHKVFYNL